jgi:two-component system LytT family response regulator
MKVVIIEDEKKASDLLEKMLLSIDNTIEIANKCFDVPSGVKSIKRDVPDVIFLDIELPVYSGLQLLEFFNEDEINFKIIFTTASNQHAIQAFEMSAIDYILKPIQEEKLKNTLQKLQKQIGVPSKNLSVLQQNFKNNGSKKIAVPISNGYEIIPLEDIKYLAAEGSYTKMFLKNDESVLISKNLKYFDDTLKNTIFIRIHRSYIVNVNLIKKIIRNDGGMVLLEDGTQLPIITEKIDSLLQLL